MERYIKEFWNEKRNVTFNTKIEKGKVGGPNWPRGLTNDKCFERRALTILTDFTGLNTTRFYHHLNWRGLQHENDTK